ncbi:hypothetical protein M501DRAFT_996186 [Patellaria atrata CBS 101060]|uniref:Uncharacterized protein n=1 Tax=Patellaria atrata CBS 101060 TaxID=1346257 RepID=A0A9P4S6V7_9PEZI|nr:hypothetical protein M501DRAFT_996186 [Patellaria atrata CBS 101060]
MTHASMVFNDKVLTSLPNSFHLLYGQRRSDHPEQVLTEEFRLQLISPKNAALYLHHDPKCYICPFIFWHQRGLVRSLELRVCTSFFLLTGLLTLMSIP